MAEQQSHGTLTAAFERTGSPFWLMDCIQQQGLDRKYGFTLQVNYLDDQWQGGRHATEQALVDGDVDFIDCDWLTLLRCRREGLPISAVYPYGRILGGLMVPPGSPVQDVGGLYKKSVGVVNRRDKNWMLFQAYSRQVMGIDPETSLRLREAGSKTTLLQWLQQGELDAAIVYWQQIPALQQQGYRLLLDIPLLLPALATITTPTSFFIFREQLIAARPELIRAFIAALKDAILHLDQQPRSWQRIGKELLDISDAELLQLRHLWHSRIAQPWNVEQLQALWPLTRQLFGGDKKQFMQAFAWSFMNTNALTTGACEV
ncbi:MAG: ABC transporter substrate-binding protein [Motiliproteus sp.]